MQEVNEEARNALCYLKVLIPHFTEITLISLFSLAKPYVLWPPHLGLTFRQLVSI